MNSGETATTLYFLQNGVIEVFIDCENYEFILEKLFKGAIINYRTFFNENTTEVCYRFARSSICFAIPYDKLMEILQRHKELERQLHLYKQKMMVQGKTFPLDYIVNRPKSFPIRNGFTE